MYYHIYDERIDAKVASIYDDPMCQDSDETPCDESDSFGYKVTHNSLAGDPVMCVIIFDGEREQVVYFREKRFHV